MGLVAKILTGGFLKGYRTYVLGGILILQAVASYLVGDMTLPALIEQAPELITGLGLVTARLAANPAP